MTNDPQRRLDDSNDPELDTTSPDTPVEDAPRRAEKSGTKRVGTIIGVGLLIVALLLGGMWAYRTLVVDRQTNRDLGTPTWTPGATITPSEAPSAISPTPSPLPAGCAAALAPMDNPQRFQVKARGFDAPVMSVGEDSDGAAGAPPKDLPNAVGWFKDGPKVGSDKGKVVLTIHTYRQGGALGNQLYEPKTGLQPGDLIEISDAAGVTQCYKFTHSIKVFVKDYDPDSDILYDYEGKPEIAIVICWDFDWNREDWDSRVIFYAEPVTS